MTQQEFLDLIKKHDAIIAPAPNTDKIGIININLQQIHAALVPPFLQNLYLACGGIRIGRGYIFGPTEIKSGIQYPIPSILQINQELTNIAQMRGKTLFGRNDLFWFVFDAFGKCAMLDNIGLKTLRQYDDPYRAMLDCLVGGKL